MQAVIAEAAARGQAGLDLVSVDSTTARAHHHAAVMVLDGEWPGPAFRSDKTPDSLLAGLHLRGAISWIRSLQPD
ncbi:hypothetical protein HD593_004040 [Nonomuraea rubra]|uniref:Uncharacterized protein n=1 Tax=Nonomuraea rubra TaxID=46180 RepID=A0A7X0NTD5_9ACTN|nr:hypothetical protein [Nonomuraea rubra]